MEQNKHPQENKIRQGAWKINLSSPTRGSTNLLKSTLKQSYGVSVSQMTMNMFRLLESQSGPFRINSLSPGWLQE